LDLDLAARLQGMSVPARTGQSTTIEDRSEKVTERTRSLSPPCRFVRDLLATAAALLCWLALSSCSADPVEPAEQGIPASVRGVLTVTAYGDTQLQGTAPKQAERVENLSEYVRGRGYTSMEENDIRGFLDGLTVHGWNQVGQTHVRVGRPKWTQRFGENEILRVLYRWDDIQIPPSVHLREAVLTLTIEKGVDRELELLLYEVKKDWGLGEGGRLRNNTSPPASGEVWWRDARFELEPWGRPGASFASETDPRADTGAMALAGTRYRPGDEHLRFSSEPLRSYIEARIRGRKPLRFLLKLGDRFEDESGAYLALYSSDHGDSMNSARRPLLRLAWSASRQLAASRERILLEHGRTVTLPRFSAPGAGFWSIGFVPDEGSESPVIEARGGGDREIAPWQAVQVPFRARWDWIELRLLAARNPVTRGETFRSELRDSWIRTGPPESQRVRWTFVSPTGERHGVDADYQGDFRWSVTFEPSVFGRWRYFWEHDFLPTHFRSAEGVFDVVAGDLEAITLQLEALLEEIGDSGLESSTERLARFEPTFLALERAAISSLHPEAFVSERGQRVRELIRQLREALSSHPLPEESHAWAQPWER
jgi:hypothetical protein